MGRVRLHSGGISPGQVRLGRRGASEALRAARDDVNSRNQGQSAAFCGWCGSTRKVDPSQRPHRCAPCRADEQQVAGAAKLRLAGQPPLGSRASDGGSHGKVRRAGEQARARLAGRGKARPAPGKAQGTAPAKRPSAAPSGLRRVTEAERRAAQARLVARVSRIERELAAPGTATNRRDLLREKLAEAERLLRHWDDIG